MLRPEIPGADRGDRPFEIPFRRCRSYGHTLLTRPRLWTDDEAKARRSPFVYGPAILNWPSVPEYEGWYQLSLLGILNGVLRFTGFLLVVSVAEPDAAGGRWILGTSLRWFGWS